MGIKHEKVSTHNKKAKISGIIVDFEKVRREKKTEQEGSLFSRIKKGLTLHVRKILILLISLLVNNIIVLGVIGLLNRKFHFLETIFVAYGAVEDYALAYFYPWHMRFMKWNPWPVGFFRQNNRWGIMFGITATEKDFYKDDDSIHNNAELTYLVEKTEQLRLLLGAEQKTFAGILPGVLFARKIVTNTPEIDVTLKAVIDAEVKLRMLLGYPDDTPLIILGGKGFLGRKLMQHLEGRELYCVDADGHNVNLNSWPKGIEGKKAILINVTRKTVINNYIHLFWPELVLLNETYPEPSKEELKGLNRKGCSAYHVVGVEAVSYPRLPRVYKGGIPCCAAWNSKDLKVILRKLI